MRNSRLNYAAVGGFVLVMLVALLAAVALLAGRTGPIDLYFANFNNVSGVAPGTQVMYEGFPIGKVEAIQPRRSEGEMRYKLMLGVRQGWPIPTDSIAQIAASGLLSAVVVDIDGGRSEALLKPGDEVRGGASGNLFAVMTDVASQLGDLSQNSLRPLVDNLNRQIDAIGYILEQQAPELLASLLRVADNLADRTPAITQNVENFSASLDQSGRQLTRVLSDANVGSIDHTLANLQQTSANFVAFSGELEESKRALDRVMNTLDRLVSDNRGPIEDSLRDLRRTVQTVSRSIDGITGNLDSASRNFNEFSRQVRQNPSVLIGGGAPAEERRR